MDEETRAGFEEMRRGFEAMRQRFDVVDQRFDADNGVSAQIRRLGVLSEDLRREIGQVAEIVRGHTGAIERLRGEMNERFRENTLLVATSFRQIHRDIDELRDRR